MASTRIPLLSTHGGGTPVSSSSPRIYNMYPSVDSSNKLGVVWKNTPGWAWWLKFSNNSEIRGIIPFRRPTNKALELYAVRDDEVVQDVNGTNTVIGTLSTYSGKVHMAEDGISLMITDGIKMYRWDGTTFSTVTLPAALTLPTGIIFHDGHFICYQNDSGTFWISGKFDGSSWDSLDFATAEDKPDNITGLLSDRVLWIFGEYTTQAYYNNGTAFPFQPSPQGKLIYGMVGSTQAQLDNTAYWLAKGKNGTLKVVKANGFVPLAISSSQIEEEMANLSVTSDAYANSIMWDGHEWYVLTFPTAGRTFVYDTQGVWFEWGEYDSGTDSIVASVMKDYVYYNDQHLFSDNKGYIQKLSNSTYNHDGEIMSSGFITKVNHIDEQRVFVDNLIVDMRTGVGSSAVMMLRISYDGGYTWGNWMNRPMGEEGEYEHRVQWHRLGSGYNIVIEGRITDEVPRQIMSGVVGVTVYQNYLDSRNERSGV